MSQLGKGIASPEAKRDAILAAAGAVFLERGYEAATTLEIATRAKTSKRALYEHFGSKQEILSALIRTSTQRMNAPLDLPLPPTREALLKTLRGFGVGFLKEFLHPHRISLYRLAISEAGRASSIGQLLDANGRRPVMEAATRLFRHAGENGHIEPGSVDTLASTFFLVLIGPLHIGLLLGIEPQPTPKTIEQRAALAVSVIEKLARADPT